MKSKLGKWVWVLEIFDFPIQDLKSLRFRISVALDSDVVRISFLVQSCLMFFKKEDIGFKFTSAELVTVNCPTLFFKCKYY